MLEHYVLRNELLELELKNKTQHCNIANLDHMNRAKNKFIYQVHLSNDEGSSPLTVVSWFAC